MSKNNSINNLEKIELPEIELQSHKRQLKRVLFARRGFSSNSVYFNRIFMFKKIIPVSAVAIIVLVVALFNFGLKTTTPVSAKEVAQKSYQAVINLSPEQKESLGEVSDGWAEILKEAINAPDLKLLSYDDFIGQEDYSGSQILITSNKSRLDNQGIGMEDMQFLQYITKKGDLMSIGIDQETKLPEILR